MTVTVPDNDKSLEPSTLSRTSLFLDWHDFHYLVFQGREDLVYDLVFFDGEGMEVDFFQF
jgi:hypothetical protein